VAYYDLRERLLRMQKPLLRDTMIPINTNSDVEIDLVQQHNALGLDFLIVNNGTSEINVFIDNAETSIDVQGGDSFSFSDIIYARIKIVNSSGNSLVGMIAGKKVI